MSGGCLDYFYSTLEDHTEDFRDKELNELVSDMAKLFHDWEWYLSGDTGEGSWNEARDAFKAKWFKGGKVREERIEKYIAEMADELRMSFGFGKYCRDCRHWTQHSKDGCYGRCDYETGCDNHRCESCGKWEAKEGNG